MFLFLPDNNLFPKCFKNKFLKVRWQWADVYNYNYNWQIKIDPYKNLLKKKIPSINNYPFKNILKKWQGSKGWTLIKMDVSCDWCQPVAGENFIAKFGVGKNGKR